MPQVLQMNPNLTFTIELGYIQTGYEELRKLALFTPTKKLNCSSKFMWCFNVEDIGKVISLLGQTWEFNDNQLKYIAPLTPLLKETIQSKARKKGEGYFKIVHKAPKLFIIETVINQKITRAKVPTESIKACWKAIEKQPLNKPIKTSTVAENVIAKELGITRFNRLESGTFDWQKLFGSRSDYFRLYYYPIKILQADGVIKHHTDGHVERLANDWDLQSELVTE